MLKTYDPSTVTVLVGLIPIGGFASGSAIKAVRSNNTFEKIEGIDGVVSRAKSLNKSGEIRFTLEQTSMSNDILSGFMIADELSGSGIVPVAILDSSSKSLFVSAFAWVRKPAELEFSKELTQREWFLEAADIDFFIGGNASSEGIFHDIYAPNL